MGIIRRLAITFTLTKSERFNHRFAERLISARASDEMLPVARSVYGIYNVSSDIIKKYG